MKAFYPNQIVRCIKDFSRTVSPYNAKLLPQKGEICIVKNVAYDAYNNFVFVTGSKAYNTPINAECFELVYDCEGMKVLRDILNDPELEIVDDGIL